MARKSRLVDRGSEVNEEKRKVDVDRVDLDGLGA
jgi:hypothetical protein